MSQLKQTSSYSQMPRFVCNAIQSSTNYKIWTRARLLTLWGKLKRSLSKPNFKLLMKLRFVFAAFQKKKNRGEGERREEELHVLAGEEDREGGSDERHRDRTGNQIRGSLRWYVSNGREYLQRSFLVFLSLVFQDETFAAPVNVDAVPNLDRDGFLVDCVAEILAEVRAWREAIEAIFWNLGLWDEESGIVSDFCAVVLPLSLSLTMLDKEGPTL